MNKKDLEEYKPFYKNEEYNILEIANFYNSKFGFSVIPLKPKSKQALISWKGFQEQKPTKEQLKKWFKDKNNSEI